MNFNDCGLDSVVSGNLEDISYSVKTQNWDWVHLNSGMERSGKSSFALSQAMYLSKHCGLKFDWSQEMKNVFWFEPQISRKIMALPEKSVVVLDEGAEALFSRSAMSSLSTELVKVLMAYGSKNLFLIINIPSVFWVDKYLRESRVRSLCDIRTQSRSKVVDGREVCVRQRGFYALFSRESLQRVQSGSNVLPKPDYTGCFQDFAKLYPEEWSWYSARKTAFLENKFARSEKKPKNNDDFKEYSVGENQCHEEENTE